MLDIGGGVGALQHGLLGAGLRASTGVDASQAYIDAAREESQRRGDAERVQHIHGDFVALAEAIAPAEIVTLDRVLCCYPDMPALVGRSVAKAERLYGFVVPRSTWWMQIIQVLINSFARLERSPFRFFLHAPAEIAAIIARHGFAPVFSATSGVWQVHLYERRSEQ